MKVLGTIGFMILLEFPPKTKYYPCNNYFFISPNRVLIINKVRLYIKLFGMFWKLVPTNLHF